MNNPPEPLILLIETSGHVGHVGLGAGLLLLKHATLDRGSKHSRDLLPQCQAIFQELNRKPADIDAIVVSAGPGSYTGLRAGIMTAKTLAYALQKPLISVPTFEVIAWQAFQSEDPPTLLEVIADAQQDRVYVQRFDAVEQVSNLFVRQTRTLETCSTSLAIMPGEAWRASLTAATTITGPGLQQQLPLLPPTVRVLNDSLWHAQLPALLHLGYQYYQAKQFADPFTLEPLYLRASSAEEQWTALGK